MNEGVLLLILKWTTRIIKEGRTSDTLSYEIKDMELSISNKEDKTHIEYTKDVMKIMTDFRNKWNLLYPEEESGTGLSLTSE